MTHGAAFHRFHMKNVNSLSAFLRRVMMRRLWAFPREGARAGCCAQKHGAARAFPPFGLKRPGRPAGEGYDNVLYHTFARAGCKFAASWLLRCGARGAFRNGS
jgi:hypothetical protein